MVSAPGPPRRALHIRAVVKGTQEPLQLLAGDRQVPHGELHRPTTLGLNAHTPRDRRHPWFPVPGEEVAGGVGARDLHTHGAQEDPRSYRATTVDDPHQVEGRLQAEDPDQTPGQDRHVVAGQERRKHGQRHQGCHEPQGQAPGNELTGAQHPHALRRRRPGRTPPGAAAAQAHHAQQVGPAEAAQPDHHRDQEHARTSPPGQDRTRGGRQGQQREDSYRPVLAAVLPRAPGRRDVWRDRGQAVQGGHSDDGTFPASCLTHPSPSERPARRARLGGAPRS